MADDGDLAWITEHKAWVVEYALEICAMSVAHQMHDLAPPWRAIRQALERQIANDADLERQIAKSNRPPNEGGLLQLCRSCPCDYMILVKLACKAQVRRL